MYVDDGRVMDEMADLFTRLIVERERARAEPPMECVTASDIAAWQAVENDQGERVEMIVWIMYQEIEERWMNLSYVQQDNLLCMHPSTVSLDLHGISTCPYFRDPMFCLRLLEYEWNLEMEKKRIITIELAKWKASRHECKSVVTRAAGVAREVEEAPAATAAATQVAVDFDDGIVPAGTADLIPAQIAPVVGNARGSCKDGEKDCSSSGNSSS